MSSPPARSPSETSPGTRTSTVASAPPRSVPLSVFPALAVPSGLCALLLAISATSRVGQTPRLQWAFWAAAAVLLLWSIVLIGVGNARGRTFSLSFAPRKQHYLQACAQGSVFLYWGWYWPPVYDAAWLIAAQVVFAYAFDLLLAWTRRGTYTLGFGPIPVVFSTNLFLWFKTDWFHLQFLMLAFGFAAKDLIRWDKDGQRAHIFNPSSFTLAVFSLALIATGNTDKTWGQEIAITQFYPPHIYVFLFLIGLPGQYFFGVTPMTMAAVVSTYVSGLAFYAATGTYFFYDSYVPIAVFLGMHLLFTDPSTSPRTELGRLIFGVLYGLSAVALYHWLTLIGVPSFYDKLLQVPLLNLSIKGIDRLARSEWLAWLDPARVGRALSARQRHLGYMTIWAGAFAVMSAAGGVGDTHRGQFVPFWQEACRANQPRACAYLRGLESIYCDAGSGWACNELGLAHVRESGTNAATGARATPFTLEPVEIADLFGRGCELGFEQACRNHAAYLAREPTLASAPPATADYPIVLRGSKAPLEGMAPEALQRRACEQGWPAACERAISND